MRPCLSSTEHSNECFLMRRITSKRSKRKTLINSTTLFRNDDFAKTLKGCEEILVKFIVGTGVAVILGIGGTFKYWRKCHNLIGSQAKGIDSLHPH